MIERVVKILENDIIISLFKEIASKLKKCKSTEGLDKWLVAILKHRFSSILSESEVFASLGEILKDKDTSNLSHLIEIKGKLELLFQLKKEESRREERYEGVKELNEDDIEGIEVMNIEKYKNTAEMLEENAIPPNESNYNKDAQEDE